MDKPGGTSRKSRERLSRAPGVRRTVKAPRYGRRRREWRRQRCRRTRLGMGTYLLDLVKAMMLSLMPWSLVLPVLFLRSSVRLQWDGRRTEDICPPAKVNQVAKQHFETRMYPDCILKSER